MPDVSITIIIEQDGSLSADAEGFEGGECLAEIEKLMAGLAGATEVHKKPEFDRRPRVGATRRQDVGRRK